MLTTKTGGDLISRSPRQREADMSGTVKVKIIRPTLVKGQLLKPGKRPITIDQDEAMALFKFGKAVPAGDQVKDDVEDQDE